ncbi:MAG: VanZ family protein [Nitrospiraceae bacterium]
MLLGVYLAYLMLFALTPFTPLVDPSGTLTVLPRMTFEGPEGLYRVTTWDVLTNIVLFVPYGFLFVTLPFVSARPLCLRLLMATISACIVSSGIEVVQTVLPRHPSVADITLNTLGALVGGLGRSVHNRIPTYLRNHGDRLKGQASPALRLLIYLLVLCALFGFPLPLAADFHNWNSEFEFYLGSKGNVDGPWLGEIYLVSLYNRVLSHPEVQRNFSAGPIRGSKLSRVDEGQVLYYDFSDNVQETGRGDVDSRTPVRLRIQDEGRVQWLTPNGLAVRETNVRLFSQPPTTPSGGRFFAHSRFSLEAWVAPFNRLEWGASRIVWYSTNPERRVFTFAEWKREVALPLRVPVAGLSGNDQETLTARQASEVLRHVVVTYNDGVEILYVNGAELGRTMQRFKNASIDTLVDFLGQQFKWPLCSALIFPMGYMIYAIGVGRRASLGRTWLFFAAPLSFPVLLQGVRFLTLNAPLETSFVFVGAASALASILIAPQLADHLELR